MFAVLLESMVSRLLVWRSQIQSWRKTPGTA